MDGIGLASHIGNLEEGPAAVLLELLSISKIQLVLECRGKCYIYRHNPRLLAGCELGFVRELGVHILNLVAVGGTHYKHIVYHLVGNALGNFTNAVGTADSYHLCAELLRLCCRSPCHVAEAGERNALSSQFFANLCKCERCKIHCAEACSLRTKDAAAPSQTFAGKNTGIILTGKFAIHSVHIADFASANADITCRNILIGTDAAPKFKHISLAETHYFTVALACGVKVRAALATAHRQSGKSILEGLLETKEL